MPSFPALIKLVVLWLVWLLVVTAIYQRPSDESVLSKMAWIGGATILAAWFTWIRLHDDKKTQKYGTHSNHRSERGDPIDLDLDL